MVENILFSTQSSPFQNMAVKIEDCEVTPPPHFTLHVLNTQFIITAPTSHNSSILLYYQFSDHFSYTDLTRES